MGHGYDEQHLDRYICIFIFLFAARKDSSLIILKPSLTYLGIFTWQSRCGGLLRTDALAAKSSFQSLQ